MILSNCNLTKSTSFGTKVDGFAQKGKGTWLWFPLVLAFLLSQCKGKIYKVINDWFIGIKNHQILINPLPIDEMVGSEILAYMYFLETPPPSPENIKSVEASPVKNLLQTLKAKWSLAKKEVCTYYEAVFISILTCQLSSFFVQNFVQRTTKLQKYPFRKSKGLFSVDLSWLRIF